MRARKRLARRSRWQFESLEARHLLTSYFPGTDVPIVAEFNNSGASWNQPGGDGSPLTLTYSYVNLLDGNLGGGLSVEQLRASIEEALGVWAAVVPLNFVEVEDSGPPISDTNYSANGRPQLRIGHHPDDGSNGTLAHAYLPTGGGLAGDLHFDTDENWGVRPGGGRIDIIEVATHEFGHALGLLHEDGTQAIMNSFYGGEYNGPGTAFLHSDDIAGMRDIYGAGVGSVTPLTPLTANNDNYVGTEDETLVVTNNGETLVSLGSDWAYLDNGSNQGTAWQDLSFNDANWATGASPLGYGQDVATEVSFGGIETFKFATTYFRQQFEVSDPAGISRLNLNVFRDDGMAVYLNGVEIARDNLNANANFSTFATTTAADDGAVAQVFSIPVSSLPAGTLQAGTNVLAVEMHQATATSSDLFFDLQLNAARGASSVLANDEGGNNLTAELIENAANGNVVLNTDGTFTYTPDPDFSGTDSFRYRASDGATNSNIATAFIEVQPTPDPPTGFDDRYYVIEDGTLIVEGASPVTTTSLIDRESVWRYLDDGSDQGTAWRETDFGDGSWAQGNAQFGYGENDEGTEVSFGPDADNKHITTYLRHEFNLPNAQDITKLTVELLRDDGAVVYLNGHAIVTSNIAPDPAFDTLANQSVFGTQERTYLDFPVDLGTLPIGLLRNGRNVIAVEVHQAQADSSDLSFDLGLIATRGFSGLTANDVDTDNDVLSAVPASEPQHGTVQINADGSFIYTPDQDFNGTDTFSYIVTDLQSEQPLLPSGATWLYLDDGSNPGPGWYEADYDDAEWGAGVSQFGYGEGDEATVVRFRTTDPNNKFATTYFRNDFIVSDTGDLENIQVSLLRDDAAAVYLNGVEVFRDNELPAGAGFDTYATGSNGENAVASFSIPADQFVSGRNVFAVEVHQDTGDSSDISFQLSMDADIGGIATTLVAPNSVWRYLDNGSDQGTAWRAANFNDELWASGPAQLGYGDEDEATVVRGSGSINAKFATTYFRTTFEVDDPDAFAGIGLSLLRDDAAAVFINGMEVFRDNNLPLDADFNTFATSETPGDEQVPLLTLIPAGAVVAGTNTIGVEVHQASGASDDLSFDLTVSGIVATNNPTTVVIDVQPVNDVPVTSDHNYQVDLDQTLSVAPGVLASADDADDDTLTAIVHQPPSNGQLVLSADGAFEYTPNAGFVGTDSFTYVADDQQTSHLIRMGSLWKYWDQGTDLGTAWREPGFNDGSWQSGIAQLGYGDGDEATLLSFGNDPDDKHTTSYYRNTFFLDNAEQAQSLTLSVLRDDSAVVYVNGQEVFRDASLPANPAFDALGPGATNDRGLRAFVEVDVPLELLVDGHNLVAVEVHQSSLTSSDLSFDLAASARLTSVPTTVEITVGDLGAPPVVESVTVNASQADPADRPGQGAQPSSWQTQRSEIRTIEITFDQPVQATAADFRLTNMGQNADADPDVDVTLTNQHIQITGNVLTLAFGPNELDDGVYELEIHDTLVSLQGQALDGDGDGTAGGAFWFSGDQQNAFYALTGDMNGDGGVSVFDFPPFAYWFAESTQAAPSYVDLNRDNGISVFDIGVFALQFGQVIDAPGAAIAIRLVVPPEGMDPSLLHHHHHHSADQSEGLNDDQQEFGDVPVPGHQHQHVDDDGHVCLCPCCVHDRIHAQDGFTVTAADRDVANATTDNPQHSQGDRSWTLRAEGIAQVGPHEDLLEMLARKVARRG